MHHSGWILIKIKNKTWIPLLPSLSSIILWETAYPLDEKKQKKRCNNKKKKVKLSIFDFLIVYLFSNITSWVEERVLTQSHLKSNLQNSLFHFHNNQLKYNRNKTKVSRNSKKYVISFWIKLHNNFLKHKNKNWDSCFLRKPIFFELYTNLIQFW